MADPKEAPPFDLAVDGADMDTEKAVQADTTISATTTTDSVAEKKVSKVLNACGSCLESRNIECAGIHTSIWEVATNSRTLTLCPACAQARQTSCHPRFRPVPARLPGSIEYRQGMSIWTPVSTTEC
jgi:hypothetical protein